MTADDFNPVTLALELLDGTTQSRDVRAFEVLRERLEKAMDFVVSDHYEAFNSSIETFGSGRRRVVRVRRAWRVVVLICHY